MTDAAEMEAALARFISEQVGGPAEVHGLTRAPGGFSYEIWVFQARWSEAGRQLESKLVLRRAPRGGVLEPYDASREFRVLRALGDTPVPVPRALWVEPTGAVLGTSFFVMEFVEGGIPLPWDESIPSRERTEMHSQFAGILARLHSLDWRRLELGFLGVPAEESDPAALELDRCEALLGRVALRPYPLLREVIARLRARRPRCPKLVIVHDDYRMGNFIWRDGRIVAVLDWERAFLGDPMADVAFTRLRQLAGWCAIEGEMSLQYTRESGIEVDEDRVAYYSILEQLKATLVGLTGLKAFADGRTSDLRLVQIGRGAHAAIPMLAELVGIS